MIDVCLICARGGSKEIKNKNITKILGKPLIAWSIIQALKSKIFKKFMCPLTQKKLRKFQKNMVQKFHS